MTLQRNMNVGRLRIIGRGPRFICATQTNPRWFCKCSCGTITLVHATSLHSGTTQSCGCLKAEKTSKRKRTHGHTRFKSRTYSTWVNMRRRCHDKGSTFYRNYGGRGIYVCDRWRFSFENFLADMGECPIGRSIDRMENDKSYYPSNCRWATRTQQQRNRRTH